MKFVTIHNLSRPQVQPVLAGYCKSFFCQLRGLMFCKHLSSDKGLLLVQGRQSRLDSSIHMFFMRFDICAVWISSNHLVVDMRLARRWYPAYLPQKPAQYVLELHADRFNDFQIGDQIRFDDATA
ncbi:MAG: DUF192 domain-containing protein [Anaerolineales bacterium]|nr:DUF192 domain-containing protein [Anaerolineales bacterium]